MPYLAASDYWYQAYTNTAYTNTTTAFSYLTHCITTGYSHTMTRPQIIIDHSPEAEARVREIGEARIREIDDARARGERLLRSALSPRQLEELTLKDHFFVEAKNRDGGLRRRFRIDRGSHRNVREVAEDGRILRTFCAGPRIQDGVLPDGDMMLAQKLILEIEPERFFGVANISGPNEPVIRAYEL